VWNLDLRSDVGHLSFLRAGARRKSGADFWVSADTYPPVFDGCLHRSGFYHKVIGSDVTISNLTCWTRGLSHFIGHDLEITG